MRGLAVGLLGVLLPGVLLLAGCRTAPLVGLGPVAGARGPGERGVAPAAAAATGSGRVGAAPGNAQGPGGFVPRGSSLRTFYVGDAARLWYYLNLHYWAPEGAPLDGLWIRAEVRAEFRDLLRWPGRAPLASPPTKTTVEYWRVSPTGRSVRLDNHKDYWTLEPATCAGAVHVEVTLTLGHVQVRDTRGRWDVPEPSYVLESRNYADDRGLGAERTRFTPLADWPVDTWGYRVPWDTGASPLTRSAWQDLTLPTWTLRERRAPAAASSDPAEPGPVITPGDEPVPAEPR
jgi:hypothetical protein